jgi:ABC-type glycerol-3-phosphate transport system substrate-binding protein
MTWTDFYDYACSAKQKAEERGIRDFYVQSGMNIQFIEYMSNYLDYINGTVTDAREEYKSFLNLYMKMMDEELISDSFATASTSLFSAGGTFDYVANDVTVFPEPLFSESCKYTVGVTLLAVNPYSEHLEEAAEYVRMASSPEVLQRAVSAYLLKDRDSYQYFDRNGNLVVLEDKTGGHAVLEYVFANSTRQYFNQDVFNEIKEYMGKVKDRTMTADEFAEIIYNKTKMVIIE